MIHGALEPFQLALVPGDQNFGVLDVGTDLKTRTFEVTGVKLGRIVHNDESRHAVTFPVVFDRWEFALNIRLGQNRVFEASHHG